MTKRKKNTFIKAVFFYLFVPSIAFAGDDTVSFVDTLNNLLGYMTGSMGRMFALLGIVGVGYGCLVMGKISKLAAGSTVLGIGIVFGAHGLLNVLSGVS